MQNTAFGSIQFYIYIYMFNEGTRDRLCMQYIFISIYNIYKPFLINH